MPISKFKIAKWNWRRAILLPVTAAVGTPLFLWLRPEGTFTPAPSPAVPEPDAEVRIRCLDHILTDSHWHVAEGGVLKSKGGTEYPSDHFGLWASLALRPEAHGMERQRPKWSF